VERVDFERVNASEPFVAALVDITGLLMRSASSATTACWAPAGATAQPAFAAAGR
jgi:hypothetical protein